MISASKRSPSFLPFTVSSSDDPAGSPDSVALLYSGDIGFYSGAAGIVECVASLEAAEARLRELAPRMGAVVTAGARDPGLPLLAKRLAGAL